VGPYRTHLDEEIETSWSELESFLREPEVEGSTSRDGAGWTVKDHLTHMAVWADSVAVLFRDGFRHQALGIDEGLYSAASFEEINEIIRQREASLSFAQAVDRLRNAHNAIVSGYKGLSESELAAAVRDVFHTAPRTDDRQVSAFIHENTAAHYSEHLPWMRRLAQGPA
jgi:hypothetical protein